MAPRPKYRAVRPFSVGGDHFAEGDTVEGRALVVALEHGETFVKADTARTRKQAVDDSTSPTEES